MTHRIYPNIPNLILFALTLFWAFLTWGMALIASTPGTAKADTKAAENPLVIQGRRLYTQLRCLYCHRLNGRGGTVGPALDDIGFRRTPEWLTDHFQDPQKVSSGSKMAKIPLKDDQIKALTAFMNSLGGRTFTGQAPLFFKQYCVSCHGGNQRGPGTPPDLSKEGRYRDVDFIGDYIRKPTKLNPLATMPGFGSRLTDSQIKDLAVYVFRGWR